MTPTRVCRVCGETRGLEEPNTQQLLSCGSYDYRVRRELHDYLR